MHSSVPVSSLLSRKLINPTNFQLGTEILGMTAAETQNPTKTIPRAIRGVYVRVGIFYILGVFVRSVSS